MRWRRGERSSDIEDRRGQSIGGRFGAGPKLGIGGILTLLALSLIFGQDFFAIFQGSGGLPSERYRASMIQTYLTVANGRHTPGYFLAWVR
jgi:uncharacterized protein